MTLKVLCYGEVVTDLIKERGGIFRCKVGGAPLNVAVGINRLGGDALFVSSVGEDWFGRNTLAYLESKKVPHRISSSPQLPTRTAVVFHDVKRERAFSFSSGMAAENSIPTELLSSLANRMFDVIYFGSFPFARGGALPEFRDFALSARRAGARTIFDPNIRLGVFAGESEARRVCRELAGIADVVRLNFDELTFLCGNTGAAHSPAYLKSCAESICAIGPQTVFVTEGAKGSHVYVGGELFSAGSYRVKVVDSTGCGDAFTASVISDLFVDRTDAGPDYAAILRRSNAAGAIAATKLGGADSMPTSNELRKILKSMSGGR